MMIGKKKDESSAELFGAPVSAMENFAQKAWIYEEILKFMEKVTEAVLRAVPIGEELTLMWEGSDGKDDDKSALRLWDFKPILRQEVRILKVMWEGKYRKQKMEAWIVLVLMSFEIFMNLLLDIYGCKTESLPNAYLQMQLWL